MKEREAYYCNLKALLLVLVVYGHWIEPCLGSAPWAKSVYRVVYTVHMPLFAFLSGVFLGSGEQARRQGIRTLRDYLAAQCIVMLAGAGTGRPVPPFRPYWHLWYLLSLSQWSFLCWGLERWGRLSGRTARVRAGAVLLAAGVGCAAGCLPRVGRDWSLSRTLVFFPYLLAGHVCPRDVLRGRRGMGLAALAGFGAMYAWCSPYLPTGFLYQAEPYAALGPFRGVALRLCCYGMGGLLGAALLALVPGGRSAGSRVGADTLGVYLCHAPLILLTRLLPLSDRKMLLTAPFASLWIVCLLDRLFRWRGQLYAVTAGQTARKGRKP